MMKNFRRDLAITALLAVVLLVIAVFGEYRYRDGASKGFELGKMAGASDAAGKDAGGDNAPQSMLNYLASPESTETLATERYTGPEAWMLNPTGKTPFWVERTEEEALALEVSENVTVEMKREYSYRDLDTGVPLSADESFHLNLVVNEDIAKDGLHEMNCYYPKYVPAGEDFEIRIVLEEENDEVYVGVIWLTAGDEDLNLVHGSANQNAWYGSHRVDCDEWSGTFTVYLYTGATEEHYERPMFAGASGAGGIVHCNFHCLDAI